ARFTGEERARAVHFDRAAFQNHPRIKNRGFQDLGHARRHDFIEIERRIFISPCVVIPIDDREFWIDIARQKNRAVIAAPGLVRRDFVIGDALLLRELITYYEIPTNEPWCRDHGPIFLTRNADPKLAIVDWDYNAWGNKYPPFNLDEVVPTRVAEILKVPVFYPGMILEGGSIEVNGTGALLSSESCLLNKNRNPNLSREEIEKRLRDFLGVREILWLGDGIEGDDTDGHIDDLARFVSEIKVVTVVEENRDDANYQPLQDNLNRLSGFGLDIVILPM